MLDKKKINLDLFGVFKETIISEKLRFSFELFFLFFVYFLISLSFFGEIGLFK